MSSIHQIVPYEAQRHRHLHRRQFAEYPYPAHNARTARYIGARHQGNLALIIAMIEKYYATNVAEINGKPVAIISFCRTRTGIYIAGMYTLPSYRGRGLMTQLLGDALTQAKNGKATTAYAMTDRANTKVHSVFRKHGFRVMPAKGRRCRVQWCL